MALIARWIEETRPAAVVVDVSVEVALFVRLLGVPVIVMAMPGDRTDAPHALVHQLADHIVAAWPRELYEPEWLRALRRQDQLRRRHQPLRGPRRLCNRRETAPTVLVLGGTGGCDFDQTTVDATAARYPRSLGRHWVCGAVREHRSVAGHLRRRRRDHPRRTELRRRRRRGASSRDRHTSVAPVQRAARHRRNAAQTPSCRRQPAGPMLESGDP